MVPAFARNTIALVYDFARERGLSHYLSRRLCPLDKLLETRERIAVVVPATQTALASANSIGRPTGGDLAAWPRCGFAPCGP